VQNEKKDTQRGARQQLIGGIDMREKEGLKDKEGWNHKIQSGYNWCRGDPGGEGRKG